MKQLTGDLKYMQCGMHLHANKEVRGLGDAKALCECRKTIEKPYEICCFQGLLLLTSNKATVKPHSTRTY